MQQIPIGVDANDYRVTVELSGVVYVLHMKWNSEGQFWVLGIENLNEQVQLSGVKIIHTSPLLQLFHYLDVPEGEIVVTNATDRMAFVENRGQMYYVEASDLATL